MKFTVSALSLLLVAAMIAGCGKTTKPASPTGFSGSTAAVDMAQASDQLAAHPTLVTENLSTDPTATVFGPTDLDNDGWMRFRPLRWWRTIDSTTRSVDIVFGNPDSTGRPTTAIATVHRHLMGKFHVVIADSTAPDSMLRIVVKPLDDQWTRLLALRRFPPRDTADLDDGHEQPDTTNHWRVVGTSGVLVTSANATVHINSIRLQAGTLDTTVTDPLQLFRLRRFPLFRSFTTVHLTVSTTHNDDIVAFYRDGDRRTFHNNGDGTYSIDFVAWDFGGLRHLGVNAFAKGTITSDTYPYDSQAWLTPFVARDADVMVAMH